MRKSLLSILVLALVVSVSFSKAFAADFTLTYIGGLDTDGKLYSDWWYSTADPTLIGTAAANADLTIKVGDAPEDSITADASGNWDYPTETPKGDYVVKISTSGSSYTFNLHTGQTMPTGSTTTTTTTTTAPVTATSETATTPAVPVTGFSQLYTLFISLVLISAGYAVFSVSDVKKEFEKAFAKETKK